MTSNPQDAVQDLLNRLQAPIPDAGTLLADLSSPLDNIGLLPPLFRKFNQQPLPTGAVNTIRHIPQIQRAILQHIAPTWDAILLEKRAIALMDQYFCPDSMSNASSAAGEIAIAAYETLLSSSPVSGYALKMLDRLSVQYPVDRLYVAVSARQGADGQAKERLWGDCVTNLVRVPGKVANAIGLEGTVRYDLENGVFFNRLAERTEVLISSLSGERTNRSRESLQYVTYLLGRLVSQGLFPPSPPSSRTQPSFFQATLPTIQSKVFSPSREGYFAFWNEVLDNLPSASSLQSILISLFGSLRSIDPPLDDSAQQRALVREDAILLADLVGALRPEKAELWEMVLSVVLKRNWPLSYTRVFVCWVSGAARGGDIQTSALKSFMQNVLELWADAEYVKHSLLSKHQYVTSLLLIAASYFEVKSPPMLELSLNHAFIQGVGRYISHQDPSVRRCGMLVGEEIARMSGKSLHFGDWDGDTIGKPWARSLRQLIQGRDVDADVEVVEPVLSTTVEEDVEVEELVTPGAQQAVDQEKEEEAQRQRKVKFKETAQGYDSDDSLTGYESPASSRSASPSPEELAEMEKDPSLNVNLKKVPRPVYLRQLGELLKGGSGTKTSPDEPHEADKIEMALNTAEELIRKKKDYGTELAENAVNLEYSLLSLNNNFELDDFTEKRQGALNALVACAPRQAAPALIEEFFKNQFSVEQRYVALNALAVGARELASLPVPESRVPASRTAFPSKTLPPSLHDKYLRAGEEDTNLVPLLMEDISRRALAQDSAPDAQKAPPLVREKMLRIKKPSGISEVSRVDNSLSSSSTPKRTTFTEVAAEYFIAPLINRFWLFLREEQMREERTAHMTGRSRYQGTGTGLILNPLVLSHFLRTLGVLVNASQNSPEWLAIVAPDALELAVTIGTRPLSYAESTNGGEEDGKEGKEASVLGGALELALVVLDGALSVDGGRSLSLEHTQLLLGANEWASRIFENLERGLKVVGEGGVHEVRLRSVAAGVLLKIDEVTTRWKRSMLDYM